ncbi:hypothetical protein SNE35_11285 [Paucibacter sp. R3-3]|uniref:Uncharacterized protein n=1 Tax=Roseateles agri TaxID=3098619 RepID=A0ABU5DFN5_9BURK|nr:hypothetical protein [Paucibacter sp. R3-3]MDY0745097.1 hypothetical protein [Paucibacter sp. R3-3]
MKARIAAILVLALLSPAAHAASTSPPAAANLLVELRWVQSSVSGAALAGLRDGGVVIGTAGSIGTRPGGTTLSTTQSADAVEPQPLRVVVMNGKSASVSMTEQQPTEWLDYGVELSPGSRGGNGNNSPSSAKVYAAPRSGTVERSRGFVVTPHWPGGKQRVQVELKAYHPQEGEAGASAQAQVYSTVAVSMGDWITVARSGGNLRPAERGVVSSRDAEPQTSRELQLRVSLAP